MKKSTRKNLVVLLLAAVAVAVGVTLWSPSEQKQQQPEPRQEQRRGRIKRQRAKTPKVAPDIAVRNAMKGVRLPKREKRKRTEERVTFPFLKGQDRVLAESIQKALDADDFSAVALAVKSAQNSTNSFVREHAVEALGWFGAEALPELTPYMADPDEDVAQSAINQWELALSELDDSRERLVISAAALGTITDTDALDSISGQFSNSATEYIDNEDDEEKAFEKRVEVVQTLVDFIDDPDERRSNMAKETYEDVTGSKWRGVEEAERYLRDPDNYEEPED